MAKSFSISGIPEVTGRMNVMVKKLDGELTVTALMAGAQIIVNHASEKAPYRTGTLRRSIHAEPVQGETAVMVGTDLEYAPFVEYGTSRMAARPFLRPAIDEHWDEVVREISAAMEDLI